MAFEHKPGRFTLFRSDKKGNDRAPDYRGDGMALDGTPIQVSAWIKEGAKGKFMSCSMQAKGEQPKREEKSVARPTPQRPFDDGTGAPF